MTFIFLFSFCIQSFADQPKVDLKTLLGEVQTQSPVILRAEAQYDESSWKKVETFQGYLPTLTGSINYLTQKRYMLVDVNLNGNPATIAQVIPTTQYSLTATLPLFDGFATTNRFSAAENQKKSAQHDLDWVQFQTQRQVTLQFYKSLAAQTLKDVAEQNLKTLNDHLKDVQALRKAGVATSYDVLRVEVQVSEARSEVLNAQDNYELSKYRLGEILGQDFESRSLAGLLPVLSKNHFENVKMAPADQRKDILALKEKVLALQDLETAASRHWAPKISAFGQYQYYNNINDRFDDNDRFREAYQIGLNLTWNLFDGFSSMAKSHEAAAQAVQLQQTLRMSELKAKQDFQFWQRKLNYFNTVYESRLVDVQKSTEAIRLSKEGRRAGTRTTTDLLDAELDLFRSKASQVNAQIGAVEALINLELATGQALYSFN